MEWGIKKILEDMGDEDLKFILTFQPQILDRLCYFLSLELQLEKEKKIDSLP
jgi:hypothetical protein